MNNTINPWNYAALGEVIIGRVIETYVVCRQSLHQSADEMPEAKVQAYRDLMKKTEDKLGSSFLRCFVPHMRLSGDVLVQKMRDMAEKNKEFWGADLLEEPVERAVWKHLTLSEKAKEENSSRTFYEYHLLIEENCDAEVLACREDVLTALKDVLALRFTLLDKEEQEILALRYGLNGEACMSLLETAELLKMDLLDVMRLERDGLLDMFYKEMEEE